MKRNTEDVPKPTESSDSGRLPVAQTAAKKRGARTTRSAARSIAEPARMSPELESVLRENLKRVPEKDRKSYERGFRGHR